MGRLGRRARWATNGCRQPRSQWRRPVAVSVPHKFAALTLCAAATPQARSIGAANVLRRDLASRAGSVTCATAGAMWRGCAPLAASHAAGVAALALHDADPARREALAHKLRAYGPVLPTVGCTEPSGFGLVINAMPAGLRADDPLPVDVTRLAPQAFVGDLVTLPAIKPLMAAAGALGLGTLTGAERFAGGVRELMAAVYQANAAADLAPTVSPDPALTLTLPKSASASRAERLQVKPAPCRCRA